MQTDNSGNASRSYVITLYKNGSPTALTLNFTGDNAVKTVTDLVHSVSFAANDRMACTIQLSGSGTPTVNNIVVSVELY
jgi:hypothetical protein